MHHIWQETLYEGLAVDTFHHTFHQTFHRFVKFKENKTSIPRQHLQLLLAEQTQAKSFEGLYKPLLALFFCVNRRIECNFFLCVNSICLDMSRHSLTTLFTTLFWPQRDELKVSKVCIKHS